MTLFRFGRKTRKKLFALTFVGTFPGVRTYFWLRDEGSLEPEIVDTLIHFKLKTNMVSKSMEIGFFRLRIVDHISS